MTDSRKRKRKKGQKNAYEKLKANYFGKNY